MNAIQSPPPEAVRDSAGERVLVVGATGSLGRPVVSLLLARGVAVRALARHPERAADLAAQGAEVVAGDLTDAASLRQACRGATRVLACAHGILGRGRWRSEAVDHAGHRALIEAAVATGVRRFVYASALAAAADSPIDFFRTKHAIEQVLMGSGLDAVVLRPAAFMEQHVHLLVGADVLTKGKARFIGPASKLRNYVCAADVARFAVKGLMGDPAPFRRIDIGGHDHASGADVAARYALSAGITPQASHLPAGLARALAPVARPFHPGLARILHLTSLPDDAFDERFDGAAALEAAHGIRLTRLDEFIKARVAEHLGDRRT